MVSLLYLSASPDTLAYIHSYAYETRLSWRYMARLR